MRRNIYLKLFAEFFKAGLFTVGGGLAMIPMIEKSVEKEEWLSAEEMVDGIAVAQSLPGVFAINIATYIGKKKAGTLGAVIAAIGAALPSFLIIIAVSLFLGSIDENRYVQGALTGVKAAAAGLIFIAGIKLGKSVLHKAAAVVAAAITFILVVVFSLNVIYVIIAACLIGIIFNLSNCFREAEDE